MIFILFYDCGCMLARVLDTQSLEQLIPYQFSNWAQHQGIQVLLKRFR